MPSLTIKSNGEVVWNKILDNLLKVQDPEFILRPVCTDLLVEVPKRIHEEGRAADGGPIGTYSKGYLNRRIKLGRGDSDKVIVYLTGKLQNDWAVLETKRGYALGFLGGADSTDPSGLTSKQKLNYVEKAKGKIIGALTTEELEFALETIKERTHEAFSR